MVLIDLKESDIVCIIVLNEIKIKKSLKKYVLIYGKYYLQQTEHKLQRIVHYIRYDIALVDDSVSSVLVQTVRKLMFKLLDQNALDKSAKTCLTHIFT